MPACHVCVCVQISICDLRGCTTIGPYCCVKARNRSKEKDLEGCLFKAHIVKLYIQIPGHWPTCAQTHPRCTPFHQRKWSPHENHVFITVSNSLRKHRCGIISHLLLWAPRGACSGGGCLAMKWRVLSPALPALELGTASSKCCPARFSFRGRCPTGRHQTVWRRFLQATQGSCENVGRDSCPVWRLPKTQLHLPGITSGCGAFMALGGVRKGGSSLGAA